MVIGIDAIGKSSLFNFALQAALLQRLAITVICADSDRNFFDLSSNIEQVDPQFVSEFVTIPENWCIILNVPRFSADILNARCNVLIFSPNLTSLPMDKNLYQRFFLRNFNIDKKIKHGINKELFDLIETHYPNLERQKDDVRDAYHIWGANPQQILQYLSSRKSSLELLAYGIQNCNISSIINYLQYNDWPENFSFNYLLSPIINPYNHSLIRMSLSSNYIIDKLLGKAWEESSEIFINLLTIVSLYHKSYFLQNKGRLFEQYAHSRLLSGGTFKVRKLSSHIQNPGIKYHFVYSNNSYDIAHNVESLHIPPSKLKHINSLEETSSLEINEYSVPRSLTFRTVDAVMGNGCMFQMTISKNHPLDGTGMEDLKKKIPLAISQRNLYLVIPEHLFGIISKQRYKYNGFNDNNKKKNSVDDQHRDVLQWALCLDIPRIFCEGY